jgi:opacity protein-like surface antigen
MLVAVSSRVNNTNNGNGVGANYAYDAVDGLTNNIINSSFIFMGGADANDMEMGQSRIKLRHRMPLKFSVLGEKMIVGNWLSVQTGLSLTYLYSEPADKNLGSGFNQRVYYLGLPVKLNYHFYTNRNFTAYVGAGAEIQKCIYAKRAGEKVTISNPQFGINASIGAQYNLAQHVALFVEPGISRYWGNKDKIETYVTENPVSFDFHAGLKLTY